MKYRINLQDDEIERMSKYKFKTVVCKKVEEYAFQELKEKASKHSKSTGVLQLMEKSKGLRKQSYLSGEQFSKDDIKLLFKLRTRMLDGKTNFPSSYGNDLMCRMCEEPTSVENEDHLLQCFFLTNRRTT